MTCCVLGPVLLAALFATDSGGQGNSGRLGVWAVESIAQNTGFRKLRLQVRGTRVLACRHGNERLWQHDPAAVLRVRGGQGAPRVSGGETGVGGDASSVTVQQALQVGKQCMDKYDFAGAVDALSQVSYTYAVSCILLSF